jgi:hypothetical protein
MVFNATFINISVILWMSVLLGERTGENHRPVACHWQHFITQSCIEYTSPWAGLELTTLVVLGTDYTGSCKSNYHTTTTTTLKRLFHVINLTLPFWVIFWLLDKSHIEIKIMWCAEKLFFDYTYHVIIVIPSNWCSFYADVKSHLAINIIDKMSI